MPEVVCKSVILGGLSCLRGGIEGVFHVGVDEFFMFEERELVSRSAPALWRTSAAGASR